MVISQRDWGRLPKVGFGRPIQYESQVRDTDIVDGLWSQLVTYNWSNLVTTPYYQIPMFYTHQWYYPQILERFNDGRPILAYNEPDRELVEYGNPAVVASWVYTMSLTWRGDIYCCGYEAHKIYLMEEVLAQYIALYGTPMPIRGIHLHTYSNQGAWASDITSTRYVTSAVNLVDTWEERFKNRFLWNDRVPIIVSEHGALSKVEWYPEHTPESLIPTLRLYHKQFMERPYVVSFMWSQSYYPRFSSGNLLNADGSLNPLGVAWRDLVP
jgi:hypothetical protein